MSDPQSIFAAWASRAREIVAILNPDIVGFTVDTVTFPEIISYVRGRTVDLASIKVAFYGRDWAPCHVDVPFPYLDMTDAEILAKVAASQEAQRAMLLDDISVWEKKVEEADIERASAQAALAGARATLKALDANKPTRGKEK